MLRTRRRRQAVVLASIVALALASGAYLAASRVLQPNLQAVVYDTFITASQAKVKNQITIVAIDDATVERYERWPLPRRAYAELIRALAPHRPSAIAFDVGFYDPSPEPEQDRELAAAIAEAGNVILAMQGRGQSAFADGALQISEALLPLEMFREGAAGLGSVNVFPDDDSRVREAQLVLRDPAGNTYYALPVMAAARHLRVDVAQIRLDDGALVLPTAAGDRRLPVNEGGAMRVYYAPLTDPLEAGSAAPCATVEQFCVVSLIDVVDGRIPAQLLANRSIYVGAHTISAVPDDYPTPNSAFRKMWGVEIWANTGQSIFTNRYPLPDQGLLATLAQFALILVAGITLVVRLRLAGFLAALGVLIAYSLLQLFLFLIAVSGDVGSGGIGIPSIGYLLPAIFWWVVVLGYLLVEEQVAVRRTQSTFGRFVTPSVARTIMDREEQGALQLGGEMRDMTVLFGDIRGFTTISEGMEPGELMRTLNQYFEGMVAIVERYEGTVNKYNGDNIMVIWNAPLEITEHPRKAVECALELQRFIQQERIAGGPDVSFGFGINSGGAVAGFLGARGRMEYTVIGDTVNVASRLTSSDIARRDQVAVSGETLMRLGLEDTAYVDLGAISVKGRNEPVRCFQIDRVGQIANPNPAPSPEVPVGVAAVAGFH